MNDKMSKATGARVMVVDDEPSIQEALNTILKAHGFRVDIATTAAKALEGYEARRPDLILLDLGLPDLEGLELLKRLRERGKTPVIILSVRGRERDKVIALDLGADDYLTKPFGIEELLARIQGGFAPQHSDQRGYGTGLPEWRS